MPLSMPIAPTRMMLPAARFNLVSGAPNFASGVTVQAGYWALDAATQESLNADFDFPDDWQTFNTFLWTLTVGTTATGGVRALCYLTSMLDAQVSNVVVGGTQVTVSITGGTTNRVQRTALETGLSRPTVGAMVNCTFTRIAADAADTYAADIGFVGVELVKAS